MTHALITSMHRRVIMYSTFNITRIKYTEIMVQWKASPDRRICWLRVWSRTLSGVRYVRQCTSSSLPRWCDGSVPRLQSRRPCCASGTEEMRWSACAKSFTCTITFFHSSHSSVKSKAAATASIATRMNPFICKAQYLVAVRNKCKSKRAFTFKARAYSGRARA